MSHSTATNVNNVQPIAETPRRSERIRTAANAPQQPGPNAPAVRQTVLRKQAILSNARRAPRRVHSPRNPTVSPLPLPLVRQGIRRTDESQLNFHLGMGGPQPSAREQQDNFVRVENRRTLPFIDLKAKRNQATRAGVRILQPGGPVGVTTRSPNRQKPGHQVLVAATPNSEDGDDNDDDDDEAEAQEDQSDWENEEDEESDDSDDYIPPSGRLQARSSLPHTLTRGYGNNEIHPSSAPSSPLKRFEITRKRPRSPDNRSIDVLDAHRNKHRRQNDGSRVIPRLPTHSDHHVRLRNAPRSPNRRAVYSPIRSPTRSPIQSPARAPSPARSPTPVRSPSPLRAPSSRPRAANMRQRYSDSAIPAAQHALALHPANHGRQPSPSNTPNRPNARQGPLSSHHPSPRYQSPCTPVPNRRGYQWDGKKRGKKSPRPWQLGYYTPSARAILQVGRDYVKRKVITENAFPDGQQKEQIARESWVVALDQLPALVQNSTTLPNFNRDILRMDNDVIWFARGQVIGKAREGAYIAFELSPPDILDNGNPRRQAEHRRQLTIDMAALHLATWKFLFGNYQMGDGRVRKDIPFTHKGLWDIIYRAYFVPKPTRQELVHLNPLPPAAIVLASTAAFCAIQEYETGEHTTIEFQKARFAPIYEDLFEKWIQLETEKPARAMNVRTRITAYCFERMGQMDDPEPQQRLRPGRNDLFAPCGDESEDDAPEDPVPPPRHGQPARG